MASELKAIKAQQQPRSSNGKFSKTETNQQAPSVDSFTTNANISDRAKAYFRKKGFKSDGQIIEYLEKYYYQNQLFKPY